MRKLYYLSLAALAIVAAGCAEVRQEEPSAEGAVIANAVMEGIGNSTKTTATDDGYFTWSNGDAITAWSDAAAPVKMTIASGVGESKATFTSTGMTAGKFGTIAVSPYNVGHLYSAGSLTVCLPAEYGDFETEYVENSWSPMLSYDESVTPSTTPNFEFSHLCGLVRFNVANVPAGTAQFQIEMTDKDICGNFNVDLTAAEKVINAGVKTSNNIVTLKFKPSETTRDMKFFIPLPVGEYNGLTLRLLDKNGAELSNYVSTKTNTMARRTLALFVDLSIPTGTGIIESSTAGKLRDIAKNGGSITLDDDVNLAEAISVEPGKTMTIELNGHKITSTNPDNSKDDFVVAVKRGGELIINGTGGIVSSDKHCAIKLTTYGESSDGESAKLIINGGTFSGKHFGISGNGTRHNTEVTINDGVITSDEGPGIYHPQVGILTINGGEIYGATSGIELRSGKLVITNGYIKSNATTFNEAASAGGSTITGAAVAISQHATDKDIDVQISGGQLVGVKSLYEKDLQNTKVDNIKMSVTGGRFDGDIYSQNCKNYISGDITVNNTGGLTGAVAGASASKPLTVALMSGEYTGADVVAHVANSDITLQPAGLDLSATIDGCIKISDCTITLKDLILTNATEVEGVTLYADNKQPIVYISGANTQETKVTIDGCWFNLADPKGNGDETCLANYWTTDAVDISVKGCTFNANGGRPIQFGGIDKGHTPNLLNATIEYCVFNNPYRYACKVIGGSNEIEWYHNDIYVTLTDGKMRNAVEFGSSDYKRGTNEVDRLFVDGGSYPSENFKAYVKAYDEEQEILGTMPDGTEADWAD